jgi:hypothetical protein
MKIQTKLFNWPDKGNHIILIARGVLDAHGLEQILMEVSAVATPQLHCKILIDLTDAQCQVAHREIDPFLREPRPDLWLLKECKTALVSSRDEDEYKRLSVVSTLLTDRGFRVATFRDSKAAVVWLADGS